MAVSPTTTITQPVEADKAKGASTSTANTNTTTAATVNTTTSAAAAPRKRRRRAPATGATEDCFSCKKRQVKCDRRRPYCGQCVEIGKECSGYRTTLTWGVGVASRGKLRGMSLPVAKSPPTTTTATQEPKTQRMNSIASTSTSSVSSSHQDQHPFSHRASIDFGAHSPRSPTSPVYSTPQEYQYFSPTSPIPIPSPSTPMGFPMQQHRDQFEFLHPQASKFRHHQPHRGPLQRLQTTLHVPFEDNGMSASSTSLGTYSDSDFPSPSEFPNTPVDEFPFADPSMPRYPSYDHAPMGSLDSYFHEAPRSLPMGDDMSSSVSSDQSLQDYPEIGTAPQSMGPIVFQDVFTEGEMSSNFNGFSPAFPFSRRRSLSIASPLSPRMLYLLDYYDRFICPVLVAFDSPQNPYRMHIIHLAMRNEELQNAIGALATNNMRMRGGIEGRRVSVLHDTRLIPEHAYSEMTPQELREMHGEATDEEKHYKANSITLLNKKLVDYDGSQDDSVLATLLILCLFHVCDSGFTKFKTQLAGVQKLLSLRDRSIQSEFVGWIETFFTWFDVMTAAVNDREIEVRGDSLDMMNLSANLGALEHHSGCEGRLFKLIARLGRLNLLSQNRPVRDNDDTPTSSPRPRKVKDFYSFSFDNMDGNGWGTPINDQVDPFSSARDDPRSVFWTEWNDLRSRLQEWEFPSPGEVHSTSCDATSSMLVMSPEQAALLHISESFRYAALLYTERLAQPTLPPSSLNFQNLVAQGLYHISQIGMTSCVNKFLLWPLFIIGTECVDPEHRAVVRQRCVEIQRESGFFNNLSGLEVLERVWREDDEWSDDDMHVRRQNGPFSTVQHPFRWRRAMDRVDGEYIVL